MGWYVSKATLSKVGQRFFLLHPPPATPGSQRRLSHDNFLRSAAAVIRSVLYTTIFNIVSYLQFVDALIFLYKLLNLDYTAL